MAVGMRSYRVAYTMLKAFEFSTLSPFVTVSNRAKWWLQLLLEPPQNVNGYHPQQKSNLIYFENLHGVYAKLDD